MNRQARHRNTISVFQDNAMKNVTITLDEAVATCARVEAASRGKSLSKFVRELIEREIGRDAKSDLDVIREFTRGPGYPRISRNWRGREELYAEREDELLRRYERTRLHGRSGGAGEKSAGRRPPGARDGKPRTHSKPAKPE